MGYYLRVFGTNSAVVPLAKIREAAHPAIIELEYPTETDWDDLILKHPSGDEIVVIERNPVIEGKLGCEELLEFIDEAGQYKPTSGAEWLKNYLPNVKVIYAFQVLSGASINDGWTILRGVQSMIWNHVGGILQADGEGFSNESGYTILWQFDDDVSGPWKVGVLDSDGKWKHFEIDLANKAHRDAFQKGLVPQGASLI